MTKRKIKTNLAQDAASAKTTETPAAKHPELREVAYQDISTGHVFVILSPAETGETILWTDGREYPLVKVEISSDSHPAFTGDAGAEKPVSTRTEAFNKRYGRPAAGKPTH